MTALSVHNSLCEINMRVIFIDNPQFGIRFQEYWGSLKFKTEYPPMTGGVTRSQVGGTLPVLAIFMALKV